MFDRVIAVNVKGVFLGLRHVLPVMIKQGRGAVVNTASVAGLVASPGMPAYVASKHAVIGLTKTAAGEVARAGVRVNAVCPGPIDTRMIHSLESMLNPTDPASVGARYQSNIPIGRYGTAEEVANVVHVPVFRPRRQRHRRAVRGGWRTHRDRWRGDQQHGARVMITAIVLYDLPPEIDREACRQHFLKIAPDFLGVRGFVRKQFIQEVNGRVAGGSYIWEDLASAKAFYNGPWLEGIRRRYGCEPRITYFETYAIADRATGYAGSPAEFQKAMA